MFTIGQVFWERGYDTKFIYGGFGYFDNMNAFFSGNGFQTVDRADLSPEEISFSNIWGVCDEDLLARVIKESDRSFRGRGPFFSIVMTTSNHPPYTYPQKIDIPSGTGRRGAIKYTDYAIARFIEKARSRPWFKDTIFVIIADHCAHSAGKDDVEVSRYHIPMLVYAPGYIRPGTCETLCSQMDVAPTVLGLLNVSYASRFFGRDILAFPPGRALVGTYEKLGLFTGERLLLLEPVKKVVSYHVSASGTQTRADLDSGLLFDAVAYYQCASSLIKGGGMSAMLPQEGKGWALWRIPDNSPGSSS
jgi:phosphoglycerol transferase MdoB-like AlkP superfamily enzyme